MDPDACHPAATSSAKSAPKVAPIEAKPVKPPPTRMARANQIIKTTTFIGRMVTIAFRVVSVFKNIIWSCQKAAIRMVARLALIVARKAEVMAADYLRPSVAIIVSVLIAAAAALVKLLL